MNVKSMRVSEPFSSTLVFILPSQLEAHYIDVIDYGDKIVNVF